MERTDELFATFSDSGRYLSFSVTPCHIPPLGCSLSVFMAIAIYQELVDSQFSIGGETLMDEMGMK